MRGGGGALHLTEEELEKILQKVARTAVEELEREAEQQPVELSETEVLTAKAKGTSDSSFLWRIKGKEAGENAFSPASFCAP